MSKLLILGPTEKLPLIEEAKNGETEQNQSRNKGENKIALIQGLRGLSIISVLIFHLWPRRIPNGEFGVDIFFVISGYLIHSLLNRVLPLDGNKVLNFYFRRLRRILPIYLFVIFMFILLSAFYIIHPLDFGPLVAETKPTLLFVANINWKAQVNTVENYILWNNGGYNFLLHLWSLSVEVQFYFLAPLIIYVLSKLNIKILAILFIVSFSFIYQTCLASSHNEHMSLLARIWQFMIGFLAYELQKMKIMNGEHDSKHHKIFNFNNDFLAICLTFFLLSNLNIHKQLTRLVILLITLLILVRMSKGSRILSQKYLLYIGNISYAVYLLHWPVFMLNKYENVEMYLENNRVSITVGFALINISLLLGHLTEHIFAKLNKNFIKNWCTLLMILIVSYILITLELYYLSEMRDTRNEKIYENFNKREADHNLMKIWKWRKEGKESLNLSSDQSADFNKQFHLLSWRTPCPLFGISNLPTRHNLTNIGITKSCIVQGKGSKNIVLIGNSHSHVGFYGIKHSFYSVYKKLVLIAASGCMFGEMEFHRKYIREENYIKCVNFNNEVVQILREWKEPIDIIIVGHGYGNQQLEPFDINQNRIDPVFESLRKIYNGFAQIARDLVIIPNTHFYNGILPHMSILQRQTLRNRSLCAFLVPYKYVHNKRLDLRQRLEAIECPTCLMLDWDELWCSKEYGTCSAIDFRLKISYFYDTHHVNAYGSMLVGEFTRKHYNKWLKNAM